MVASPFTFLKMRKPSVVAWHLKKFEVDEFFRQNKGDLTTDEMKTMKKKESDAMLFQKNPCVDGVGNESWKKDGQWHFQSLLSTVFKPFYWEEYGNITQREVSPKAFRRSKIDCCRLRFDKFIRWKHVASKGASFIRHSYHQDFFNEVIRQVMIEEPVQGILMKRMCDEIEMTIDHLKCMYDYIPLAKFEGFEKLLEEYNEPRYIRAQEESQLYIDNLVEEIEELRKKRARRQSELTRMLSCNDTELNYKVENCTRKKKFARDITDQYKSQFAFFSNPELNSKDLEDIIHPKDMDEQELRQFRNLRRSSSQTDDDEIAKMLRYFNAKVEQYTKLPTKPSST